MIDQFESLQKRRVKAAILSGHDGVSKELQRKTCAAINLLYFSALLKQLLLLTIPREAISLSFPLPLVTTS